MTSSLFFIEGRRRLNFQSHPDQKNSSNRSWIKPETLMNPSSMTRRHLIGTGLATCGYLAAAQSRILADDTSLVGYTKPAPETRRGLAPRLQHRVISTGPYG